MKSWYLLAALAVFSTSSFATEYIYRDLQGNTLPSPTCAAQKDAETEAAKPFNLSKFSKRFCQSQGYGWHVEEIKDGGKTVCTDCSTGSGKKQCHLEDMVVTCKRIKPGSVGMLPGKG